MTNRTAAARYARALFDVARQERADLDAIDRQLADLVGLFKQYPALEKALVNPVVPVARKRGAIAAIADRAGMLPIVSKLLGLLAERDRLALVPEILESFRDRVMDYRQVVRAVVTTAAPLPESRTTAIQADLARATGRTVKLTTRVDPAIVGGLVARVGSTIYDGSVTGQLGRMRQKLLESV